MKSESQLAEEIAATVQQPPPAFLAAKEGEGWVETVLYSWPGKRRLGRVRWSGQPREVPLKYFADLNFYATPPKPLPMRRKESPDEDEESER
jgi:hypothetical protein